jgi:inner membrane protein
LTTIFTHAVVAATLVEAWPVDENTRKLRALAIVSAIVPDADVFAFAFGIAYGDLWGHRGLTHSLFFAALWSAALVALCYRHRGQPNRVSRRLFVFLTMVTASHGVLDAMTNGGLGIAFFAPFNPTRYFLPWTPIEVSPIGAYFFSRRGISVLLSELQWVWLPCACFWLWSWWRRVR